MPGKRQEDFWDDFFGENRLSSEEKRAVRKEIPMTESLLFSIIAKLDFFGMYDQIVQLTEEYESLFLQGAEKAIQNSDPFLCRKLTNHQRLRKQGSHMMN